jgi:murein DD-endopeptidase MepM/ murein hydrolase activator NlpD
MTPTVAVNAQVSQGQQIGVTDNSGCQLHGHIHMRRTDPSGTPVNFTIPCVNPTPKNNFADGLVDDDVPDNL